MRTERGFTNFELLATVIILMILASAILPTAKVLRKRQKEIELRRSLRIVRTALDGYHDAVRQGRIGGTDVKVGSEGYPPDLDVLVKGVSQVGKIDVKLKFLRRVPVDPMTGKAEWGKRCYQDEPDDTTWCGENVWDVYSQSQGVGLDGSKYKEW
ncbi:MAG: general secretion pathway protein GspG [Acidobacteria bacterium]|nr:MAG: general secretion pathway protein GspG [Acidobacteriota bacterium]